MFSLDLKQTLVTEPQETNPKVTRPYLSIVWRQRREREKGCNIELGQWKVKILILFSAAQGKAGVVFAALGTGLAFFVNRFFSIAMDLQFIIMASFCFISSFSGAGQIENI